LLLLAMIFLLTYIQSTAFGIELNAIFGVELKPFTEGEVYESLFEYEEAISIAMQQGFEMLILNLRGAAKTTLALLFRTVPSRPTFLIVAIVEAICLFCLKVYVQGRFAVTPGQWLFGTRTLRSTLLPCGFARALVRSVLCWVDIPFFMTPIPAAMSLMLSRHQQRLGDRVADTVVVNAASLRNSDEVSH
jgi:uncharacterized RDD family membrane protein YckC